MSRPPLVASVIEPTWQGHIGAILAAGPSIEGIDLSPLDNMRVIAINHAWRIYTKAHTALGGDLRYFRTVTATDWKTFKGPEIVCFSPRAWAETDVGLDPRTIHVGRGPERGLAVERNQVSGRQTCVTQAMSYLVHRGVSAIVLVGIDLQPGPGGRRYAFRADTDTADHTRRYRLMFENFKTFVAPLAAKGIPVFNCSPTSKLKALWGYVPLDRWKSEN